MRQGKSVFWGSLIAQFSLTKTVAACSVCFGDKNSTQVQGIGWGMLVLLGVVLTVFILFGTFIISFNKRSRFAVR